MIFRINNDIAVPALTKRHIATSAARKYRLVNKERLTVERRERYLANMEEKSYQREHYKTHTDEYLERQRKYYVENIDAVKEKQAENFKCPCGGRYTRSNKLRHERSDKHIRSFEVNEVLNELG